MRVRFFFSKCFFFVVFIFIFGLPRHDLWVGLFFIVWNHVFSACAFFPFHSNGCWRFEYISPYLCSQFFVCSSFVLDTLKNRAAFLEHSNSVIRTETVKQSEIIYQARILFVKINVRLRTCNYIAEREQPQSNRTFKKEASFCLMEKSMCICFSCCAFAGSHFFPAEVMITYIYHGDKSQQLVQEIWSFQCVWRSVFVVVVLVSWHLMC